MGIQFYILAALGGGLGSVFRAFLGHFFNPHSFLSTLAANLCGAFLIGLLTRYGANLGSGDLFRAFWIIGICGGFTTFSTFGMDIYNLGIKESWTWLVAYISANFLGSLILIWLGFKTANLAIS